MRYIKYVILVWIVIQSSFLKAQQYPVDVQLFVTPPYQQSLRDYWATFEPKMQVYLLLKDLNSPIRNVALGFSLENVQGQPLAQTPNFLQPFQTQLTSGVRKTLSNIELKPLFAFENLQGVSEHFYNDLLPEGAYFMCFTAYDVATQMPLSAKARTLIQIRRYTPPLPTLPAKGEIISKKNQFQHLVFQWMLRDPAPFTQYEFTLKEVWDNSLSPDEAFISGRLVYQGKVPSNTILYGTDKPILLENKRYVWKVRAFTQNPNNPNQRQSFFYNNGESEAFYFDYVSHCEAPKFLTAITKDNTANIRWSGEPVRASISNVDGGRNLYKILYREKGKNWKSQLSNHPQATLIGLKRGRNYVYKVGVACGLGQTQSVFSEQTYLYSTEQEFVTPHKQNDSTSVQCGVKPEIRIRNREPLQEVLGVNETFVAGDFPVTIIRATGSNGVFSGEGYVQVPYLLDTKIKVKFDGIKINSERQLIAGKLVTTYDKTESNVILASEELRKISEDIKKLTQKKREETEAIFGKQGEEFEKELQEWAIAEEKRQIEIAQIEKQDGITDNSVAASVDVTTEPAENKTETQKTSEKKAENKKDTKSDEPYYIEHNDKKYYDGDILKMPYIRRKYERFVMGNLSDSTTINWTLYQRGADKKILESYSKTKNKRNTKTFDFTKKESDIATLLSLEAQAETEGNPKVEVFIEKEVKKFKYNELKAIDNENKNRVAKSGETLYYVHQTGKEYDFRFPTFQIDINPKVTENEIPTNHIEWIYNGTNIDHDKLSLSRTIHYNDDNKGKIEVQARTGNPMAEKYKKVNVEWVDNYHKQVDIVPAGIKNALKILSDYVNNVGGVLSKIDKTGRLEFNISFQGQETLEEDKQTRFYNIVRDGGVSGSIDFAFKGFKYGADLKIATAEIFVKPIIGLTVDAKMRYERRSDKEKFTEKGIIMNFGLQADLQVGGKIGVDIKVVNISANPYAGISSWGGLKYSNIEKTIEGKIGIGKPYVGLKGELKLGGYNIIPSGDIKKIWEDIKYETSPIIINTK